MGLERWKGRHPLGGAFFLTNDDITRIVGLFHWEVICREEDLQREWEWSRWKDLGPSLLAKVLAKRYHIPSSESSSNPSKRPLPLQDIPNAANLPGALSITPVTSTEGTRPGKRGPPRCGRCKELGHRRKCFNRLRVWTMKAERKIQKIILNVPNTPQLQAFPIHLRPRSKSQVLQTRRPHSARSNSVSSGSSSRAALSLSISITFSFSAHSVPPSCQVSLTRYPIRRPATQL